MSKESSMRLGKIKTKFTRQPLPPTFSRIVSVMLTYVDRDTYYAWPSKQKIAKHVGCSEKTVARNLQAIKQLRLFECQTLGSEGMRRRLGDRFKPGDRSQRLFTLYQLNVNHPLWSGKGIHEAKDVIRKATHAGISRRVRTAAEADAEPVVIGIHQAILDVDQQAQTRTASSC